MLEILQLYVSGFWIWLGITIGASMVSKHAVALIVGVVGGLRGTPIHIGDINETEKD